MKTNRYWNGYAWREMPPEPKSPDLDEVEKAFFETPLRLVCLGGDIEHGECVIDREEHVGKPHRAKDGFEWAWSTTLWAKPPEMIDLDPIVADDSLNDAIGHNMRRGKALVEKFDRDVASLTVEVTGLPMRGKCGRCGVDLDKLAAAGRAGHVCYSDPDDQDVGGGDA